jgi:hypothetical protein
LIYGLLAFSWLWVSSVLMVGVFLVMGLWCFDGEGFLGCGFVGLVTVVVVVLVVASGLGYGGGRGSLGL